MQTYRVVTQNISATTDLSSIICYIYRNRYDLYEKITFLDHPPKVQPGHIQPRPLDPSPHQNLWNETPSTNSASIPTTTITLPEPTWKSLSLQPCPRVLTLLATISHQQSLTHWRSLPLFFRLNYHFYKSKLFG